MFSCLLVALLGVAVLAGCGGGSSNSISSTATTATSGQSGEASGGKTSSGEASGGKTSSRPSTSSAAGHPLTPRQRVDVCKRIIQAPSTLSASTKAKLEKTCEQTGASPTAQREIVRDACVVLASREPAGAARERALTVCRIAP
jgi:hypothetical protein